METVTAFNIELCSLYSTKPPISKTKMVELTKLAMKAAKFYKHVVQSIEKFINKCQPEFKIPGLYVIDSIVRQSRHQFGADKDVFSQRFSKNIAMTFHNLLACPAQDICKIIRVLNLWQKNSVFPPTIIQPLLDMAADPSNAAVYLNAQRSIQRSTGMVPSVPQPASGSASASRAAVRSSSGSVMDSDVGTSESQGDVLKAISQLLQQPAPVVPLLNPQQLQLHLIQQQLLQQLQVQQQPEPPLSIDGNLMAQIQALTAALMSRLGGGGGGGGGGAAAVGEESVASEELVSALETSPGITKKFMDVSYTESDLEDDRRDVHSCSSLSLVSALPMDHGKHRSGISDVPLGAFGHSSKLWSPEELEASRAFGHDVDRSHDEISDVATPRSCQPRPLTTGSEDGFLQSTPCVDELPLTQKVDKRSHLVRGQKADDTWDKCYGESNEWSGVSVKQPSEERLIRKSSTERHENPARESGHDEVVCKDQSSSRSDRKSRHFSESVEIKDSRISKASSKEKSSRDIAQSTSIEAENKLSRGISRSRSRSRNSHRSRSRSRSRTISSDKKHRSRSPDHNHSWRHLEHEKPVSRWHTSEFLRNHQVPLKEQHVSIISLTVWIGNVSRQVKDELLRAEVTRFGKASINLVPQRGCAFACFETRQEAERAIEGLNNMKLMDKTLKVAWAPNLGIKESEFKSRWDVELGITYVPWDRLPPDLEAVAVGGVVDEKSLPEQMKISSKSAPVFRDDQMTSNEVTSSTDCQQDGQGPVTPSNTTTLPGNSLPSVAHLPLVPGTSASDISPRETAKEVAMSLPLHAAETSAPAAAPAEKDACSKISVEPKASQELSLIPEISLTRSQFVQGIQNILNSANASSVNSAQSVPGIIAPGAQTPTSTADVLFPPVPGIWPSLCGFNPHVPPPGFLPTFDPTRPPPSFGQTTPAGEPASLSEKKQEESNCRVIEDTSENMDLDDSGSSSQGDEQDFLESQIELVCADPASSGLRFAESESKNAKTSTWSLDRDKSGYVGQNVVASADSSWNSTSVVSSTAVPNADLTSLSCAVSDNTLISSGSNDCTVLGPPFKKALISLESSQNSSGLSEKPASISIIPGPVLDGSNNGSLKSADGCFAPRNPELTIHSNLGPVGPFVDKPNNCLVMAPSIPFHGQGMVSHGPPNTPITLGDRDHVSLDKERHALELSAGSFIGTTPHLQSEVKNEGRQVHDLLGMPRGISAPHSEIKPPFDFGMSGDPNRSLSEIAMSKSMPMGLPGKQNQISCGPGSYGIATAPGPFGNRNVLDSHGQLPGRLVDASQQMPDGSQRSIRPLGAPDGNPQMDARQNLPFRMPVGPDSLLRMRGGQMPIISDSNGQNCLPFGAEVGSSLGPDGPSQMSFGHVRMPFGPNGVQGSGQNQISDGPHTMQGSSFGSHGPNQLSVDGKERGFGGLLAVHGDPVRLPGMPFAPVPMPSGLDVMRGRPPHIDGPNLAPNMSGMQSRPQQISEQMPRMYDRGLDVAIGANRMPVPNQIPNTNQMSGSHGIAVSNQMTISNQLPGQVLMSGGAGGPLGASPDASIEKYGLRPGQAPFLRMFSSGPGVVQPGHGGVEVGSTGSILGPGLQFPLGIARMMSSNSGGPASVQQCVLPFVPEIMPSLDGMTRDGRRDASQNHERVARFGALPLGEGGLPSASGIMPAGSGDRFFGPAGMNRGPSAVPPPSVEGTLQNPCNAPMGFNRPAFIPSNVPDSPVIGLNRPPFGPLVMSSSSFGGRGTPSGPGPVFAKPMESAAQLNCNRDQPFGFNRSMEIGMKLAVSGPPGSDFPLGFSGNQPFVKSDVHSFANRTGSGDFDQNLVANQKLKCGILENAEKMQLGGQQCLPTSICGGMGFQGLLGLRSNSVDGKPLNKPVGLLGIDGKMNAMPSIFSSMDGINLVPGQQAFVAQDQFFLKPQIENLQQIESRGWHDDADEDDGRTAGRHIRRSDLFPSLRQRGRHQHGGHRWHDRRHDHRDFKDRGGRNRDYFHRFGSRDNRAGGRSEPPANASGKDHQSFDSKTEVRFDAEVKSESKPGFNKSDFECDVKSECKADTNLEIYDKKTVAEMEIQCTEVKAEAAADVPDSVVAANACDSS